MPVTGNDIEFQLIDQDGNRFTLARYYLEFILYDQKYLALDEADEEAADTFLQDYVQPV